MKSKQKTWAGPSQKKAKWLINIYKFVQSYLLVSKIGKCKSKLLWDTDKPDWPKFKTPTLSHLARTQIYGNFIHNWWDCKLLQPFWKTLNSIYWSWRCMYRAGQRMWAVVSMQNTELILVPLLINYCIIFHANSCKPAFDTPCMLWS